MRNLYDINTIHIEVTNACNLECANCTRFVGHHRKTFMIDMDQLRRALSSLEGFKGNIGIMGGEPTLHPKFEEICKIVCTTHSNIMGDLNNDVYINILDVQILISYISYSLN